MVATEYADAVTHALGRLRNIGFEHGSRALVNHAPMAAEAIAHVGYSDAVPDWIEQNLRTRRYAEVPEARWALDARDETTWAPAVGDYARVTDWTMMFERELADRDWREVLSEWWLRLLPGMSGALTHGVIRTAHAARALATAGDDPLRRQELARGLSYWAARYSGPRLTIGAGPEASPEPDGDEATVRDRVAGALDLLVVENAGFYAELRPRFPVPLIHAVTAPAAVRLVVDHLPGHAQQPSYAATLQCCTSMRSWFGGDGPGEAKGDESTSESCTDLMAAAVELGDEHAIKLAEVAVRHHAVLPDDRYAAATRWAIQQISRIG